jgi:hypothetical protein
MNDEDWGIPADPANGILAFVPYSDALQERVERGPAIRNRRSRLHPGPERRTLKRETRCHANGCAMDLCLLGIPRYTFGNSGLVRLHEDHVALKGTVQ